jgi:hypothetical protein
MKLAKYRKKPLEVEAIQLTKSADWINIAAWCGGKLTTPDELGVKGHPNPRLSLVIAIYTLEGIMVADEGDWIIKGTAGEFYPCKAGIFDDIYEVA